MGRIGTYANAVKIMRWQCQTRFRDQRLNVRNLLGACLGSEEQPFRSRHCATRRGEADLLLNPATPAYTIETRPEYGVYGSSVSAAEALDTPLNQRIGLNLTILGSSRRNIFDAVPE